MTLRMAQNGIDPLSIDSRLLLNFKFNDKEDHLTFSMLHSGLLGWKRQAD